MYSWHYVNKHVLTINDYSFEKREAWFQKLQGLQFQQKNE